MFKFLGILTFIMILLFLAGRTAGRFREDAEEYSARNEAVKTAFGIFMHRILALGKMIFRRES